MRRILGGGIWETSGVAVECYHIVREGQPFFIGNSNFKWVVMNKIIPLCFW
jgi:hypothetical protein